MGSRILGGKRGLDRVCYGRSQRAYGLGLACHFSFGRKNWGTSPPRIVIRALFVCPRVIPHDRQPSIEAGVEANCNKGAHHHEKRKHELTDLDMSDHKASVKHCLKLKIVKFPGLPTYNAADRPNRRQHLGRGREKKNNECKKH